MDLNQLIWQLVAQGSRWVAEQREVFYPVGAPLPPDLVSEFAPFFDLRLLTRVRIATVPAIANPGFLEQYRPLFREKAIPLLDFGAMDGITFLDAIVLTQRWGHLPAPLIFHELVHVVQYDILGAARFVELFITGWVNQGFNYAAIPLEMDAYELQNWYATHPHEPFAAREEVSHRLALFMED